MIYLTNRYFNFSLLRYSLQTKIGMPSSASSPYNVVITFDADTTIVISHHLKSCSMQFPSKNQKYKRRPDSEIHESETVAGFLSQQLWPNRLFRIFLQVSQPHKPRNSVLQYYSQYVNLFDISKKKLFQRYLHGNNPNGTLQC